LNRWRILVPLLGILAILAIVAPGAIPHSYWVGAEKPQDEGGYQAALASYAAVLKPGMTRTEVQDYLRAKKTKFTQMGGVDNLGTQTLLVKVGEERPSWNCSENYAYVAFHFNPGSGTGYRGYVENGADSLKEITVYHQLSGCL